MSELIAKLTSLPAYGIAAALVLLLYAVQSEIRFGKRARHPGYLGSLLVLNGIVLASGNWVVLVSSLMATLLAYTYRIRVEDRMLVGALGQPYADYRREVRALFPIPRR